MKKYLSIFLAIAILLSQLVVTNLSVSANDSVNDVYIATNLTSIDNGTVVRVDSNNDTSGANGGAQKAVLHGVGITYKNEYMPETGGDEPGSTPMNEPFSFEISDINSSDGDFTSGNREYTSETFAQGFDWVNFRGTVVLSMDVNIRKGFTSGGHSDRTYNGTDILDLSTGLYFSKNNDKSVMVAGMPGVNMIMWSGSYSDGMRFKMITGQDPWTTSSSPAYAKDNDNVIGLENDIPTIISRRSPYDSNGSSVGVRAINRGYANGMFGMGNNAGDGTPRYGSKWIAEPITISLQAVIEKNEDYEWYTTHYMNGRIIAGTLQSNDGSNDVYMGFSGAKSALNDNEKSRIASNEGFRVYIKTSDSENDLTQIIENVKVTVYGTTDKPASDGNTKIPESLEVGNNAELEIPVINNVSGGVGFYIPEMIDGIKVMKVAKNAVGLDEGEDITNENLITLGTMNNGTGSINVNVSTNDSIMDWDNYSYKLIIEGATDIIGSLYNPDFNDTKTALYPNDIILNEGGKAFLNNSVILYKGEAPQIYSSKFYMNGSSEAISNEKNYLANKIEIKTGLSSGESITLTNGVDSWLGSVNNDGICVFDLGVGKILGPDKLYTIKKNEAIIGTFESSESSDTVWAEIVTEKDGSNGNKTVANLYNLTNDSQSAYLVFYTLNGNKVTSKDVVSVSSIGANSIIPVTTSTALTGEGNINLEVFNSFDVDVAIADEETLCVGEFVDGVATVKTKNDNKFEQRKLAVFKGEWTKTTTDADCAANLKIINTKLPDSETGEVEFNIDLSGMDTGRYVFALYIGDKVYYNTISYADSDDNVKALDILTESLTIEEIKEKIKEFGTANDMETFFSYLEVDFNGYEFNNTQKEDILRDVLEHNKMQTIQYNKLNTKDIFKKYIVLKALEIKKTSKIEDISDEFEIFAVDGPVKKWYNYSSDVSKSTTDLMRTTLYSKFMGKSITSDKANNLTKIDVFENMVCEEMLLTIVKNAESQEQLKRALKDFENSCSLNSTLIVSAKVLDYIWKNSYATISDLKLAMNDANSQDSYKPGPSGGGSGGGGIGGSNYKDSYFVTEDTTVTPTSPTPEMIFKDVDNSHWAKNYIEELYIKGIISGTSSDSFSPSNNVKREEFAKMIVSATGLGMSEYKNVFKDVDINDWFATYIITAFENTLVNGIFDDMFGVGLDITRQDIAVILYRTLNESSDQEEVNLPFVDSNKISDYAIHAVSELSKLKIIKGYEDGTFRANEYATRAEAAKMVCEFMKIYAK